MVHGFRIVAIAAAVLLALSVLTVAVSAEGRPVSV
jgi:hypothetical protein